MQSSFLASWQSQLAELRREVWKAAIGEIDAVKLQLAAEDFIKFGIGNEAALNKVPTARPVVEAFVASLGSPNSNKQTPEKLHENLKTLIQTLDTAIQAASEEKMSKSITNNVTVVGGKNHSFQVGDNNEAVIEFQLSLSKKIESLNASPEEKEEAKSLLSRFVEHPLINTILGAGLGNIGM